MSRHKIIMGLSIVLAIASVMTAGADTHYVAHGGQTPSGSYTSWESAASNIQDAINQAVSSDIILVSNGTYKAGGTVTARIEFGTKNITLLATSANPYDTVIDADGTNRVVYSQTGNTIGGFVLTNGYAAGGSGGGIYFGWSSGSKNLELTNCIIEGNTASGGASVYGGGPFSTSASYPIILKNCIIRGNIAAANGGGAAYCILTNDCQVLNNRSTNSTALGGGLFTCTMYGGTIAGNQANARGGCDRCFLYDVTVSNNTATGGNGGGMQSFSAYGCRFYNNSAASSGGGIYDTFASNCWFSGNYAVYGGAASGAGVTLIDCVISNNGVSGVNGYGGGFYDGGLASNCLFVANTGYMGGAAAKGVTLVDCVISNNTPRYCAGITSKNTSTDKACTAIRCVIIGNTATLNYGGGAFGCYLTNCLIAKNKSASAGAYGCTLVNCTIVSNENTASAGGVAGGTLTNCIVWGNIKSGGAISNYDSSPVFTYSCTTPMPAGAADGGGNTNANPQFVDIGGGNYRLAQNSPCVDAGTNQSWMAGDIDLGRGIRIDKLSGHVDMGAYEYMHQGALFSFR